MIFFYTKKATLSSGILDLSWKEGPDLIYPQLQEAGKSQPLWGPSFPLCTSSPVSFSLKFSFLLFDFLIPYFPRFKTCIFPDTLTCIYH